MAHDHQHGNHDHHHHGVKELKNSDINTAFIIGILLNVIYVIVEIWYGYKEGSTALLSDAVHNIGDVSGLLLAFLAFKLLKIKSGNTFTYGFKKGTVLASFINSFLLIFAIGAIAWEGLRDILNPQPINGSIVIWVASIGILINFGSALLFRNKKDNDLNIKAAYWHLMADALVSLGVVIAGIIIYYTSWYFIDGVVSIIIAIVIAISTWQLFKDSMIGILDGVPASIDKIEIESHLKEIEGILDVHHVHIWSVSTNENGLTAHIKVNDLNNIESIKQQIKSELKEHQIDHSTLEFESPTEICREEDE